MTLPIYVSKEGTMMIDWLGILFMWNINKPTLNFANASQLHQTVLNRKAYA